MHNQKVAEDGVLMVNDLLNGALSADSKAISKHAQTDKELQKSEEKFRLAFHTSPDSINLNTVEDGIYLDINEGFTKIMGYTREDVIGKSSIDLNIWRNTEDRDRLISGLKTNGVVENLEAEFIGKDGQIKTGLMSARILNIDNRDTIISITRDISYKKQMEKRLIENENRYRQLVESITESIWEINTKDIYTYMSPGSLDIYGLDPEEMIGRTPFDFMDAEEAKRVKDIFFKIKAEEEPFYNIESIVQHLDGRDRYIETTGFPFFDNRGKLIGYRGTAIDITARKENELDIQTLVESTVGLFGEKLFKTVVLKLCEWLKCECAIIGKILNSNSVETMAMILDGKYLENFSYQLKGSPCEIAIVDRYFVSPENVTTLFPDNLFLAQMGASGYTGIALENSNSNVIGVLCCISRSKMRIAKQTRNVMKIIAARLSSAIEREKSESERQLLERKLQQSQKMEAIGTLAGGIAHDFNNILTPIIGYTEMLSDEISKESQLRPCIDEIYAASMRAKALVRQILTFSRQEHGELVVMKMQHILKEVLTLIRSTLPKTIAIRHDIRNDCGVIKADPTQIHQIVMNLATNAYHAMEERGGTMKISLKEVALSEEDALNLDMAQGVYACLTVSDTGVGMDKDLVGKIFDPFFTTKERGKGTGIGLSVVDGIVKSAGGTVHVNSEPDKGTEIDVYFPVVESYIKKEKIQENSAILGGGENLLIVDDEAVLVKLQRAMLERLGYQVTSYTNSTEALEAFRSAPDRFDLVITDFGMPNISGEKLAVELIKIRNDIPILICTGFSAMLSEKSALSMGIKGFLMKPVTIVDLDKKIRDVLNNRHSRSDISD